VPLPWWPGHDEGALRFAALHPLRGGQRSADRRARRSERRGRDGVVHRVEEAHAAAAGKLQLALVLGRMDLGDDAVGVVVERGVAMEPLARAGALDALERGADAARVLRVADAGVVSCEDVAAVNVEHERDKTRPP
jgi:hypothetical protein